MTADILTATSLGYISGAIGFVIALALVLSLTMVNALLRNVGGSVSGHVPSIAASLGAVADSTDPVPPVVSAINKELATLAGVLSAVEGHMSVARRAFDANAEAR